MNLAPLFEENYKSIRELSDLFYPKSKEERLFFTICFFLYASFSLFFAFNTYLLDHPIAHSDLVLGFDNQYIFKRGYSNVTAHPFMSVFSMPIVFVGNMLATILGYKFKTVIVLAFSTYLVVQGQVLIRRYLSEIIGLKNIHCNLLVVFFAVSASNLLLSMLYESFTFSFFFLCVMTYYYSYKIKSNQKLHLSIGLIFAFTIGGTTLTNLGKTLTPFFFEKIKIKRIFAKQVLIISAFITTYALFSIMLIYFFGKNRVLDIFKRYENYTDSSLSMFETVKASISGFFGAPLLLPDFQIIQRALPKGPYTIQILYDTFWQYGFTLAILTMLFFSIIYNWKNKLVLFIAFNLFFDIVLHLFLQYGLNELIIFAGHWVFTFPLLIGWLIKKQNNNVQKVIAGVLIACTLIAVLNNGVRLYELYQFGLEYHGA